MKHTRRIFFVMTTVLLIAGISFVAPGKERLKPATGKGFAVIELFTSEGCSSCPAADALLSRVAKEYPDNVYVLSFHVDYWNRLGWRDVYSNADYTKRQGAYSSQFNLSSIYTPQAVVNGKTEFTGSDEKRLRSTLKNELATEAKNALSITAKVESNSVKVEYKIHHGSNDVLNIALVQINASSNIKAGENEGKVLHHTNVVRAFKMIKSSTESTGNISVILPQNLSSKDGKIIGWLQNEETGVIDNAAESFIN